MACFQMRWSAPELEDLLLVLATTSRESNFSPKVTLQIIGGKLLANAPYALIAFDHDIGGPVLEIIFPANQKANMETELNELALNHGSHQTLDSYIRLERCLRYSITWRLAPAWNQVEHKLVMRDQFLEGGKNCHQFVEFNLSVSSKILLTITNCGMIRFRPLTIETLFPVVRNNESERERLMGQLSDGSVVTCAPFSCVVLPSLREASVVAVSQKPFGIIDTTHKMSSYWTGRYGYRLDDNLSACGSFYCEVIFTDDSRFLYPACCLKLDRGSVIHRHSDQRAVRDFRENISRILDEFSSGGSVPDLIKFRPSFVTAGENPHHDPEP